MPAISASSIGSPLDGYVGVDVVDLTADRLRDRGLSPRFLDRVFTDSERARIRKADFSKSLRSPAVNVFRESAGTAVRSRIVQGGSDAG